MIELQHLERRYGDVYAVRDLSVTFPAGQLTALLGPSGCGKTTTLRMINRLIEPTAGQVLLNGQDTHTLPPEQLRRGMGYVIQQAGLFPHWTVAQNVATVPKLLGQSAAQVQARVNELLELVGLEPHRFRDLKPAQLSGGQAQRVGVARALAADPPIMLMDEPFGALDQLARDAMQRAFLDIQRHLKKTIIMVTHDIEEAFRMADRVVLMRAGTLEQAGTPDDLILRPASDFVREFLGPGAALAHLAGLTALNVLTPGPGVAGLPSVPAELDARSIVSIMIREGVSAVNVEQQGQPVGVVRWENLGAAAREH